MGQKAMIQVQEPPGKGRTGKQQCSPGKSQEAVTPQSEGAVACHIIPKSWCSLSASCFYSKQKQLDQLINPTKYPSSCKKLKLNTFHFGKCSRHTCTCTTFNMEQELLQDLEAQKRQAGKQRRVAHGAMGAAQLLEEFPHLA